MTEGKVDNKEEIARVTRDCIKQFTTQHNETFLDKIYEYVVSDGDNYLEYMQTFHPEVMFVLEVIRDVYKYIIVPELREVKYKVKAQGYVDLINLWVLERLNGILSGLDTDFIIALSGEKYEKKSVKTMTMVILPSYGHLSSIRSSVTFHAENRLKLERSEVHAVRKQLNMADNAALAVCKNEETKEFETVGLISSKHIEKYPRFVFHENMEWDFCVPGKSHGSRVRYFRGLYVMPIVSLEEEISHEIEEFLEEKGDQGAIVSIIKKANECDSGSILIFAEKTIIEKECRVLIKNNKRGMMLNKPIKLCGNSGTLQLKRFVKIDGALMIDLDGKCHACGVILDGELSRKEEESHSREGASSRGSRYNSSVLYINAAHDYYKEQSCGAKIMGLVKSDDGMLDLLFPDSG